jgi:hypothetical protein
MLVLLLVSSQIFLLFGGLNIVDANIPATWIGLKHAMHTRFVPPHYQHDLLQKLTHLEQGKNYVQEYYQELQTGMIRCGIVEDNEAMLARFFGGLNNEI